MDRLNFLRRQRKRTLPYITCVGLIAGLSKERDIWRKPRSQEWWETTVNENFDEQQWIENFRMRRETFDLLCSQLEETLSPKETQVVPPLDVRKQVAIAIYFLASSAEYRTVANLFGVGKSTVCECIHKVCNAIVENLMEKYVSFPKEDELKNVIQGYEEKWNFPNCGGAIDGSHIPIIGPCESHGDYLNRKGFCSLILQAVCDYRYIFRDVNIGWPGRVHDARVFANSEMFYKSENNLLFPDWKKEILLPEKRTSVPVVLIGDPAYPLKPWLLKPYSDRGQLTDMQRSFNYRLSRARMTIENAFGRLKGRWRCIQKRLDVDVDFASTVIATCVILHNICELHREDFLEQWFVETDDVMDNDINDGDGDRVRVLCGKWIRDDIVSAFAENVL